MTRAPTRVILPYGRSFLSVDVPALNLAGVLERQEIPALKDEARAITRALNRPIASAPLKASLKSTDKVAVIVTDNTRACPDDRLLPPLLAEIEKVVPRRNILIVVALGLHAPLDQAALIQKLGGSIVNHYRVENHDPRRTVRLGVTSRGTPVEIYRRAAEADFLIGTGFIEPHFFAGFSGGRKSVAPGISSQVAISHNHSYRMLDDPKSRAGVLRGNPVHEDQVEQARIAGLDFILNVLLDRTGRITAVLAGDPVLAHQKGCRLEKRLASASLEEPADITLVSNSGAPLDLDFYQTCKGLDTADRVTRPGGIILVASVCNQGIGPQSFFDLQAACRTPGELLTKIANGDAEGVTWQNQVLARVMQNHPVYLVSCLSPGTVRAMHIHPVDSLEAGLAEAFKRLGKEARVAVIPDGPRVLARVVRRV